MSVIGMTPTFTDVEGWKTWRAAWRVTKRRIDDDIRLKRKRLVQAQKASDPASSKMQRDLHYTRVMARKMLDLLEDGRNRIKRIFEMERQIADQMATFPMVIQDCKTIDFHYNKGSTTFPSLPMWVVKAKGKSFYVHHVTANVPWSTRETPDGSTRGMIRIRDASLRLTPEGEAIIEA
jgi:hypothetical protein